MMDYSKNKASGYKTFYSGSAENLLVCDKIRLYYSKVNPINLLKLEELSNNGFPDDISNSNVNGYYKNNEGFFKIDTNSGKLKFDTIIYFSNVDGRAIGYTYFYHLQESMLSQDSFISEINIHINFSILENILGTTQINIINTLSSLSNIDDDSYSSKLSENWANPSLSNNYATIGSVNNYFKKTHSKNYVKYTNFLGDLTSDLHYSTITDCLTVVGGESINPNRYHLRLAYNQKLNDYNTSFTRYFVGNLKNDIVLYQWGEESWEYRVISLTKSNSFNIPKVIIPKNKVEKDRLFGFSLQRMAGVYAIFYNFEEDLWAFITLLDGNITILPRNVGVSVDPWDEKGSIVFYNTDKDSTILSQFPKNSSLYIEFLGLCLDQFKESGLQFIGKIGGWFIFNILSESKRSVLYSSSSGNIIFSADETILPINNRCILVQHVHENETFYTFYFTDGGTLIFSDEYCRLNMISNYSNSDKKISLNSTWKLDEETDDLERVLLIDGLRHRSIISYDLPPTGFISSYSGILFYEENNNIKYL